MCLAVPGRIVSVSGEDLLRTAKVDFGGIVREVSLSLLPEANVEDWVLVHAGFALNRIDEDEAERTLEELRRLDVAGGGDFDRRNAAERDDTADGGGGS